jgi:hypothetical protein
LRLGVIEFFFNAKAQGRQDAKKNLYKILAALRLCALALLNFFQRKGARTPRR